MAFDLLDIRMRLSGAKQAAAEAERASAAIKGVGVSAKEAGAAAATGARGVRAFQTAAVTGLRSASAKLKAAGTSMKTTGANMTRSFTVPLALIGGASIKMSLDFDQAMKLVQTQAGASAKEVAKLRQPVLDLAAASEFSPQELAEGLFRVESAGFRGAKAMDVLSSSVDGASVGQSNLGQTTAVLGAAVNSNIRGARDYQKAMGTLNAAVGQGSMKMEDLVGALSTGILPAARKAGLDLNDITSAIGTMTRAGVPAQASATRLGMTIAMMQAPTDQAAEALKGIGLGATELNKTMRQQGLVAAVAQLSDHLKKLPKAQQDLAISQIFGGGRTSGAIKVLLQDLETFGNIEDATRKKTGKFGNAVKAQAETPLARLKTALSTIQVAFITLGDTLIPIVVPALVWLATAIGNVFKWFDSLPQPVKIVGLALAGILMIAGPLLSMLGMMALGIMAVADALAFLAANPIVLVIAAVVALVAGLVVAYHKVDWFHNLVDKVWDAIVAGAKWLGKAVVAAWNWIKEAGAKVWKAVSGAAKIAFKLIRLYFAPLILWFKLQFEVLKKVGGAVWGFIKDKAGPVFDWIKEAGGRAIDAIKGYAKNIAQVYTGIFNAIKGPIVSIINFVIDRINNLIDAHNALPFVGDIGHISNISDTISSPSPKPGGGGGGGGGGAKPGTSDFGGKNRNSNPTSPRISPRIAGSSVPVTTAGGAAGRFAGGDTTVTVPVYLDGRKVAESVAKAGEDREARR